MLPAVPEKSSLETTLSARVATLTLARTEVRNALSDAFLGEVVAALTEIERAGDADCAVIAGQREYFSVGADLRELAARDATDVLLGRRAELWRALREVRLPLVAAVSGTCLGGGFELALSCDLIVASPEAVFGQPETALGLIPGGGGSQMLVRLVGPAVAADMVMTGRLLDAEEAWRLGVVARLSGEGDWLEAAQRVAAEIAARPRLAQILAKQALGAALETPLAAGVAYERALYQLALGSDDARAGLAGFTAKRSRGADR
jgi:enoyl-CoA hydratase/carnithine racemase